MTQHGSTILPFPAAERSRDSKAASHLPDGPPEAMLPGHYIPSPGMSLVQAVLRHRPASSHIISQPIYKQPPQLVSENWYTMPGPPVNPTMTSLNFMLTEPNTFPVPVSQQFFMMWAIRLATVNASLSAPALPQITDRRTASTMTHFRMSWTSLHQVTALVT